MNAEHGSNRHLSLTPRFRSLAAATLLLGLAGCGAPSEEEANLYADETTDSVEEPLGYATAQGFAWVDPSHAGTTLTHDWFLAHKKDASGTVRGTVRVSRISLGNFKVTFTGIGSSTAGAAGQIAHAVALNPIGISVARRCGVKNFGSLGSPRDAFVDVACETPSGGAVDAQFVVQYGRAGTGGGVGGYVTTKDNGGTVNSTWNSTGNSNRVVRTNSGRYNVFFPGLGVTGGSVQVTTRLATAGTHCKARFWGPNPENTTEQLVQVDCWGLSASLANGQFNVSFSGHQQVGAFNEGAYAWADKPTTASYTPNTLYSFNSGVEEPDGVSCGFRGTNSAGRYSATHMSKANLYFLRHSLLDDARVVPFVGAYGADSKYCTIVDWFNWGSGTNVDVACYTASGSVTDSQFTETFTKNRTLGPC